MDHSQLCHLNAFFIAPFFDGASLHSFDPRLYTVKDISHAAPTGWSLSTASKPYIQRLMFLVNFITQPYVLARLREQP